MRVTLIGSGNVATVLGRRIHEGGHVVQQVYSRNPSHAETLALELSATAVSQFADIDDSSDLYLVCLADQVTERLSEELKLQGKLIAHTAGSVSINALKDVSNNYGVLYPLQTLRKELKHSPFLPILVDGNNPWNKTKLSAFAQSFADRVEEADDEKRKKLHLAAVMCNNFSNYLFSITEEFCEKEGVDFRMIVPLLEETAKRVNLASPREMQTGPAIRNDESTLNKHRSMLKDHPAMLEVYNWFTAKIPEYFIK
jgi:predicted short-subunit dehydrogenase-like oxidoreductase (DUF2520 family)